MSENKNTTIHHVRLMSLDKELEWRIVCSEQLEEKAETTGNIGKVTCKNCREKSEARLKRIQEKYGLRIGKIPWVKEAVNDGVFEQDRY